MRTAKAPRGSLRDIRTGTNQTSDAEAPQRKFLRLANLELKRALCNRVREAAVKRVAEMDEQLAEITQEQAQMLRTIDAARQSAASQGSVHRGGGQSKTPLGGRLTLKYGSRPQIAARDDARVGEPDGRSDEGKHTP